METDEDLQGDPELFSAVATTLARTGRDGPLHSLISRQRGGLRPPVAFLAGTRLAQEGLYAEAAELFKAIPEADRDEAVWFNTGLAQSRERHFSKARQSYFRTIDFHPDYDEAYFHIGADYAAAGDANLAAAWLLRALELSPERPDIAFALFEQLLKLGYTESVAERLRPLLAARQGHPLLKTAEGQLAMSRGDLPAARKAFDQALALNPQLTVALVERGRLAKREGNFRTAGQFFERAAIVDPKSSANLEMARLAFAQGQNAEAMRLFTEACHFGCFGEEGLEHARALLAVGRDRDALVVLDRQTRIDDAVTFHHLRFRACQRLGRVAEAAREKQAAELARGQSAETLPFEAPKTYVQ